MQRGERWKYNTKPSSVAAVQMYNLKDLKDPQHLRNLANFPSDLRFPQAIS